ncbi:hypothetical protein FRB94_003090 [Tulasnella sp. JGI-2019a]|nr:hypothetical protein FRB94_003090 [Tulasnella sp. JGI-2019a]KAG9006185.1 hypothetical protein FRB93_008978 [Tulasnella sp. JGI-2019a]KAG9025839.1 hypothetical protein FRB95_009691 [Tulasnella sp. JGI-2019a]
MSLKAELETWGAALKAYDEQDYERSIELFDGIADTSKILCNVGLIYATIGEHELAVKNFATACKLDPHLAIGYFQAGVSNFLLKRYKVAYNDFEEALLHLRLNKNIDYEQLGLKFQLWRAEVLFNKGLCQIYMGNMDLGMRDLDAANQFKALDEHDVISEAITERGQGYTVFSIPVGILYRPADSKLNNVKTKDYMGKATLVAATEAKDAYTDFVGVRRLQDGLGPTGQRLDRPSTESSSPPPSFVSNVSSGNLPRRTSSLSRTPVYNSRARFNSTNDAPGSPPLPDVPRNGSTPPGSQQLPAIFRSTTVSGNGRPSNADDGRRPSAPGALSSPFRPDPSGVPKRSNTMAPTGSAGRNRAGSSDNRLNVEPQRRPSRPNSPLRIERQQQQANAPSTGTTIVSLGVFSTPLGLRPDNNVRPDNNESSGDDGDPRDRRPEPESRGVTQFYDSYFGKSGTSGDETDNTLGDARVSQSETEPEIRRVAAWTSKTVAGASPDVPPSRTTSMAKRAVRKTPSRKTSNVTPTQRPSRGEVGSNGSVSQYDEDESRSNSFDGSWKIRIRIHYRDELRGMAIAPQCSFEEFQAMIVLKFGVQWSKLVIKFNDEDGGKISLKDAMDWDMAVEVSRASSPGGSEPLGKSEGKLEVWLSDL